MVADKPPTRIVAATMTSVAVRGADGKQIAQEMERAGCNAVMQCAEMGITDPARIIELKLGAMRAVREHLTGRHDRIG